MRLHISDGGDLKALARDLRKAGDSPKLRRQLTTAIRTELKPVANQVKAGYRSGPSRSGRGRLRAALAGATVVQVRTSGRSPGAFIAVRGKRMPDGMGRLPRLYEGQAPWRHPLYGNREVWFRQDPHPTFYRIVRRNFGRIHRAVEKVATGIVRTITKG